MIGLPFLGQGSFSFKEKKSKEHEELKNLFFVSNSQVCTSPTPKPSKPLVSDYIAIIEVVSVLRSSPIS